MHKTFSHLRGFMFWSAYGDGNSVYEFDNSCEYDDDYEDGIGSGGDEDGGGGLMMCLSIGDGVGFGGGGTFDFDYGNNRGGGNFYTSCLLLEEGNGE